MICSSVNWLFSASLLSREDSRFNWSSFLGGRSPNREGIEAALHTRLANAGSEATNNGVRLLTRLAYGFHSPTALIALIKLKFGGVRIPLPFRYTCRAR
jgi:transposase